jgi:hypothetical protein
MFVDPYRDNVFPWLSPETGETLVAFLIHDIPRFEKLLRGETGPKWVQIDNLTDFQIDKFDGDAGAKAKSSISWELEAGSWSPVDMLFNVFAEVVARRSLAYPFDCNDATTVEVLAADGATAVIPRKEFYLQAIDWIATQLERALVRASCSEVSVVTFRAVLHIILEPVGKKTTTTFCDVLCRRPGTKKYTYTRQGTLGQEAAVQSTQLKNRCLALLKATPRHGHLKPKPEPRMPDSVPRPLVNPYRNNVFPWLSPESGETLVSYLLIDPERFKRIIASHDNVPGWEVTDALDGVFSEFINRRSLAYMCDSYDATTVQVIRAGLTPAREIDLVQKDDFYLQAIDWVATQLERAMRANVHLDAYGQRVLDSMNETLDGKCRRVDILCRRPGWTPKRKRGTQGALTPAQEAGVQAADLKRRCLVSLKEGRHGQLLTGDEAVIYKKARDRIATRRFAETSKARNQHFWGLFGRTGMSAQVSFDAALGKPALHEPQISQGGDELGLGH